jgi:hypothetical protein
MANFHPLISKNCPLTAAWFWWKNSELISGNFLESDHGCVVG